MDEDRRRAIEWDCARVLTRFINALDAGDYETMAGLMAENGVWMRPGGNEVGPEGLLDAMKDRPRDLMICHVVSNVVIEVADEDNATGVTYLTVYRHRGPPPESGPARLAGVHMVYAALGLRSAAGNSHAPRSSAPRSSRDGLSGDVVCGRGGMPLLESADDGNAQDGHATVDRIAARCAQVARPLLRK